MSILNYLKENQNSIKYLYIGEYEEEDEEYSQELLIPQAEELVIKSGLRMLRDDNFYVVAFDTSNEQVVGVLYYSFSDDELRWSICVDEQYRNSGIAKRLYSNITSIPEYEMANSLIAELIPPFTLEKFVIANGYKKTSADNNFRVYTKRL